MKATSRSSSIEILETRIVPSTLDIVGGVLKYTASSGSFNSIAIFVESVNGGTDNQLLFRDSENITLGSGAQGIFSYAFGGQSDVRGSLFTFNSFELDLGDQNDSLFIDRLTKPLTADTGAGTDSARISNSNNSTPLVVNGALSIKAETIRVDKAVNSATNVSFTTDNLDIGQFASINATQTISFVASTAGREFSLGTENAGRVSLTAAEASNLSAPFIKLGDASSGQILNDAALDFGSAVVGLKTAAGVTQSGAGAITAAKLAVDSVQAASLTGQNSVGDFAGRVTNNGSNLSFTNNKAFQIASFAGVTGLSTTGGTITLTSAGAVTQTSSADILTSNLTLAGAGSFALNAAINHIGTLSANTTGGVSYKDSSSFSVSGITTSNGDVELFADGITINGAVNAGIGKVTLAPFTGTPEIRIGAGDSAGVFGVTDAEMDLITAATLQIGANGATNVANVVSAITPASVTALEIHAASITATGGASIVVPTLTLGTDGAISFPGANDVDTLVFASGTATGDSSFADADGFTLGHPFNVAGTQITTFDVGTATVTLPNAMSFNAMINGNTAGTGYDQVVVNGTVNIAGATLTLNAGGAVPTGTEFVLISNDGEDAVTGTFDGLDEGDTIPGFSPPATITYVGGDGNDVAIVTVDPLAGAPAANGKSITFRDVDGDIVTIKTSKGTLTAANLTGYQTGGPNGASLFQKLTLDSTFTVANITITAKPSADGGNGFVNLGYLDAVGVDLGIVSIAGDVARVTVGSVGGDAKVPAMKSLTVQSIGLLGDSTLAGADLGFIGVETQGALPKLTVKDDLRGSIDIGDNGSLGTITIGGSMVGANRIEAAGSIGLVKIVGDIRSASGAASIVARGGVLGALTVDGSIIGRDRLNPVNITAYGQPTAPTKGTDVAIKSVTIKGSVENANFLAGGAGSLNADASIGSITVGGDWLASSATAGVNVGPDSVIGTADDAKYSGGVRDNVNISASIGSFTVKGQAFGTTSDTGDMFGVVAEQIGKAKVGTRTFAFKADKGATLNHEAFFAAPTLTGAGTENPAFDFTIRELGSTTPTITTATPNLVLSADSKTATFTDVDGDIVTVKRTAGTFVTGDCQITPTAALGGLLAKLTLTSAPNNALFNVTITAKVGPTGGNGFVNVGEIDADGVDVGSITVGGELQGLEAGDNGDTRVALGSLTVQSLGTLGGTSLQGDEINGAHGLGKITVKSDIRSTDIFSNQQDSGNLASLTVGGSVTKSTIQSAAGIGTIKIGGSFRDDGRIQAVNRIAAITIGGDLHDTEVEIFAKSPLAGKGPDNAIGKLTIGGNTESSNFILGRNNNADTGIGTISVGHAWIASTILAGTTAGLDGFIGTVDDAKVTIGAPIDTARISTIASLIIKGQALGTPASGDHFGIVAQQIGKAKIGTISYAFKANTKESFAAAPTGPGMGAFPFSAFDFYLHEVAS